MIERVINFSDDGDKKSLWKQLALLKGRQEVCIKMHRERRSLKANAWYWKVVIRDVAAGILEAWGEHLTPDETHLMLKDRFMRKPIVDRSSGEIMGYTHATTVVNSELFSQYLKQVIKFAAESLNVEIASPGEIVRSANK